MITITGTEGADTLQGDGRAEEIFGFAGDDSIVAGAGRDRVQAGTGDDTVWAGAGDDTVYTGGGTDIVYGGAGDDRVVFTLSGGSGATDSVSFMGGDGVDTLDVSGVGEQTSWMLGADLERFVGGFGIDLVRVLGDTDRRLEGGWGDDSLLAGGGDDTVLGGADDDYMNGGLGADRLYGGSGRDRVSLFVVDDGRGVVVDLAVQDAWQADGRGGQIYLSGIEDLSGTDQADRLSGDAGSNWLWGHAGDDVLKGRGGDDLLQVGSSGAGRVNGGAGIDTLSLLDLPLTAPWETPVSVSLAVGGHAQALPTGSIRIAEVENMSGSLASDILTGDRQANVLAGDAGSDTLVGAQGRDTLYGDGRFDRRSGFLPALASDGDGGTWRDDLRGGAAQDTLVGGGGADTLTGGIGADHFVYLTTTDSAPADGSHDLITDFAWRDKIDLANIDADVSTLQDDRFALVLAFSGTAGEIVIAWDAETDLTHVMLDTDGDRQADAIIDMVGNHADLTVRDFYL